MAKPVRGTAFGVMAAQQRGPHVGVSKRGRMSLPSNKAREPLKLTAKVAALPVPEHLTFGVDVAGNVIAWNGNQFLGDNFTLEQFAAAL